jgi:hypothetical protein
VGLKLLHFLFDISEDPIASCSDASGDVRNHLPITLRDNYKFVNNSECISNDFRPVLCCVCTNLVHIVYTFFGNIAKRLPRKQSHCLKAFDAAIQLNKYGISGIRNKYGISGIRVRFRSSLRADQTSCHYLD